LIPFLFDALAIMDFNQITDWELIRLSNEDSKNFKHIVERYQDRIFRYLKRISYFSNEDVEDIVQEVFIKVYRNMNDFESTDKFSSLIYRIAHNHLIDRIRKSNSRVKESFFEDEDAIRLVKSEINLEHDLAGQETVKKIKVAIEQLPENYREALVLKFLEEKKIEEIVDILRKPQGTVATLIRRGREMLKSELLKAGVKS